jgi:predicted Fe-Mo cluster-binding NifX family protein
MRVCIPTVAPGGPDAVIPAHFDLMETVDFYDLRADGSFDHAAETRYCGGGCFDVVEAITKRGVEALVLRSISPSTLGRFRRAGVKVYFAGDSSPRQLLKSLAMHSLAELNPKTQTSRI